MSMEEKAHAFFDACDTGKGWAGCSQYCHPNATFEAQAEPVAEISSLQAYVEWMKDFFGPVPDARYEVKAFALDAERRNVTVVATLHGTNTGDGPVPPTGNLISADYVYVMQFGGDLIGRCVNSAGRNRLQRAAVGRIRIRRHEESTTLMFPPIG